MHFIRAESTGRSVTWTKSRSSRCTIGASEVSFAPSPRRSGFWWGPRSGRHLWAPIAYSNLPAPLSTTAALAHRPRRPVRSREIANPRKEDTFTVFIISEDAPASRVTYPVIRLEAQLRTGGSRQQDSPRARAVERELRPRLSFYRPFFFLRAPVVARLYPCFSIISNTS